MKKTKLIIPIFLMLTGIFRCFSQGNSSDRPIGVYDRLDPRIDNLGYWLLMAEKGMTPRNPAIMIPPAVFRGSLIHAAGIKTMNSPDIPVCNQTNVTESENSLFIDPDNADVVLNSNNSTGWDGTTYGTIFGANHFLSTNSGLTWNGSVAGAGGGGNWGDPATSIGLDGRKYVNFISAAQGQGIAWSDDGSNWSKTIVAPNPGDIADKNHLWIDNSATSPFAGNLYVGWTDFGGADDGQIRLTRSVSQGVNWSTPLTLSAAINAGSHNQGVNIQTGPNGEVYAVWAVYDNNAADECAIGFAKSYNGGVSFLPAKRIINNIKGIRESGVTKNHRVNSFPVMAVDISNGPDRGNIYVVWTNIGVPGINSGSNRSAWMIRSTDGGTTWSAPVRVNQGPFLPGKEAYFPWISCDTETGVLSAVFYDDRNTANTMCETFVAWSDDAGGTWQDFVVSDVAFTPLPIPDLADGYMGDYLGITSKGGKVYPCWTDTRGGRFMSYVSPIEIGLNARFSAESLINCTGQAVTFTNLSTGSPAICEWSFPGGNPSSFIGQTPPPITYDTPGTYHVSLTVTKDSLSDTELKTNYITIKKVIADFSAGLSSIPAGNYVTYNDHSRCSPDTWQWSFPGGTPSSHTGQNPPPVVYPTTGLYNTSLVVTNSIGTDTLVRQNFVNVIPALFNMTNGVITTCTGNFYDSGGPAGNYKNSESYTETFYPASPSSMIRFSFSAFSTELNRDTMIIYNGASTNAAVIGKYFGANSPGVVTANNITGALTFRFHSDGSITKSGWNAAISCFCICIPPVADFSASITNAAVNQTVAFSDLSTNYPFTWNWSFSPATVNFINGTGSASQNPQVQFTAPGNYTATLIVSNAFGSDTLVKTSYITATTCTIDTYPWNEGFENQATVPFCWTQAQINSSGINWNILKGNGSVNPAAAHSGVRNACLKDNSSADNKTRLITPTFNLTGLSNPRLKFWHTQQAWYSDQDYLVVYYRSSPAGAWVQLASYTASITSWTQETITLPNPTSTYSIAFEGNAKWGHGVCIDDVEVTGVSPVPVTISLENISVSGTSCFDASETISVAGNGSYFSVPDGGRATLIAGQQILLHPGTSVLSGGYLHAWIAPEGPYCLPAVKGALASSQENPKPQVRYIHTKIFPNPTSGAFAIEFTGFGDEQVVVEVFGMCGERVIREVVPGNQPNQFSIAGKPAGIYLVRISGAGVTESVRMVKQ
jgi:PKD repeat protein